MTFELKVEEECHVSVRGNVMESGDDAADKEVEDAIIARLERGDSLAWCCVVIEASWKGFKGFDSLGCCTCADDADVELMVQEHDMRATALESLNQAVYKQYLTLKERAT